MKKLPRIYTGSIPKGTGNNNNLYYSLYGSEPKVIKPATTNSNVTISELMNVKELASIPVVITTKNKSYDTYIVLLKSNYLVTLENEKISLNDIISIKRKDR